MEHINNTKKNKIESNNKNIDKNKDIYSNKFNKYQDKENQDKI